MFTFKKFMDKSEEEKDLEQTLGKLPQKHQKLVQGFKYKFHAGNTLNGDDEHVGYMDPHRKEIAAAGSWRYPREWVFLHEVAHQVWDHLVTPEKREEWATIVKNTKHKQNQSAPELFCMAYACVYSSHKLEIHNHPEWEKFILGLSK